MLPRSTTRIFLLMTKFNSESRLINFCSWIHNVGKERFFLYQLYNAKASISCSPTSTDVRIKHVGNVIHRSYTILVMLVPMENATYIFVFSEQLKKSGRLNCIFCPFILWDMEKNKNIILLLMCVKFFFHPVQVGT